MIMSIITSTDSRFAVKGSLTSERRTLMESRLSSNRNSIVSLLRYTILISIILSVSACGRMPNLIPYGYGDVFDDSARASTAARVDYPIVVSPNPNDPQANVNLFRVTRYGERLWIWDDGYGYKGLPSLFRPPKWYRLDMYYSDQRLCTSEWVRPSTEADVTPVTCHFNVSNYYSKPILGLLIYSMHDDGNNLPPVDDERSGTLSRTYYFIPFDQ